MLDGGLTVEQIAQIAHETNRAYCLMIGDTSQREWSAAEQWQRDSAIKGVAYALTNPDAPASAQHDAWLKDKESAGWTFGPIKDPVAKTHPCIVPYDRLPIEQRLKDYLFKGIVNACAMAARAAEHEISGSSVA